MPKSRSSVEQSILTNVEKRWPELTYQGRLPGYRYCFSQEFPGGLVSIYKHLVVQHRRKARVHGEKVLSVRGFWCYSFFPEYRSKGVPPELTHSGELAKLKDGNFEQFFNHLKELERAYDGIIEQGLDRDGEARKLLRLLNLGRTPPKGTSAALIEHCREFLAKAKSDPKVERDLTAEAEQTAKNIANFLSAYRVEGDAKEAGQFSVEAGRARQKLADFQLKDRQEFLLYVIASGIAGKSPEISLYVDSDDIVIQFQGEPLGQADLEDLFTSLISGEASRQGRFLAVGLSAASSLEPKSLYLESWHDGSGFRLDITSDSQDISQLDSSPFPVGWEGHRLHFRDQVSLKVVKRFFNSLRTEHPEYDMVRERLAHAPVPIKLPGAEDCRNYPEVHSYFLWEHKDHPVDLSPIGEGVEGFREASPGEVSVLLLFGPEEKLLCQVSGLDFPPPVTSQIGFWALVVDNSAKQDLSLSSMVDGPRWEATNTLLIKASKAFRKRLYEGYSDLPKAERVKRSLAMQRLAASFPTESGIDLPIYLAVPDQLTHFKTLRSSNNIQYTEKHWKYGPREGDPVYLLAPETVKMIGSRRLFQDDKRLETSQYYFEKKAEWLQTPTVDVFGALADLPKVELKGFSGFLAPTPKAGQTSILECYSQQRLLEKRKFRDVPGLLIITEYEGLAMNDLWTALREDNAFNKLEQAIRQRADGFYRTLAKRGTEYIEHCLHYLLHLQSSGSSWRKAGWEELITLKTMTGQSITLSEILEKKPWQKMSKQDLITRPAALAKAALIPWDQLLLVARLDRPFRD